MSAFWKLLLAFLALRADEDEGPGDDDEGGGPPDSDDQLADTDDGSLDDLLEVVEPTERRAPAGDEDERRPKRSDDRRREIEEAAELAARRAVDAARPMAQPGPDPIAADEDARYNQAVAQGSSKEYLENLAWQIQSNRTMRANAAEVRRGTMTAQDIADKTQFDRLELTKPKTYKKYADKVEEHVANARRQGQLVPRSMVLAMLLGQDVLAGKVKTRSAPKTVDRGRTPGVRGDVSAKGNGKLTKGQAAAKRLDGVHI
jgi:hypothetical protein